MGYRFGEHRYSEGRYSRWPDWWHDRLCHEGEWDDLACDPNGWADATPEPPYFPLLWEPVPSIETAWESKPPETFNPWGPVDQPVKPLPTPPPLMPMPVRHG
jgi:hypothetical protein